MKRSLLGVFGGGLVLLSACEPPVTQYGLKVVSSTCLGTSSLEGATHLRFQVQGEGMSPVADTVPLSQGSVDIPLIPPGQGRVVEVRAIRVEEGHAPVVVAAGRSMPFEVSETPPDAVRREIAVFVRRVNAFTPVSSAAAPERCATLASARAGHTATLLPDGRVLIAGGFYVRPDGKRVMLSTAELFNPSTGQFEDAELAMTERSGELDQPAPRAFHTATALPSGRVVIAGGEVALASGTGALRGILEYDPLRGGFSHVANLKSPRSRHGAAADAAGRVIWVGGVGESGAPAEGLEWYDSGRARSWTGPGGPTPLKRLDMSVSAVQGGSLVAVAGGSNGTSLQGDVLLYKFDEPAQAFALQPDAPKLKQPRRAAAAAPVLDAQHVLVVGGYGVTSGETSPLSASELLTVEPSAQLSLGPSLDARGDACAAVLEGNRVLAVGGRSVVGGSSRSSAAAEVVTSASAGGATAQDVQPLGESRYFHTCTPLKDGSVLVVGGLREALSGNVALSSAEVFTPVPLD